MWLYNSPAGELTEAPVTDPQTIAGLVTTQRIDAAHLLDRQLQAAFPRVEQTPAGGAGGGLAQTLQGPGRPRLERHRHRRVRHRRPRSRCGPG